MSPSASVAVAEHVSAVVVVTPESGLMLTEAISGAVLSTVTEAVPVSVPSSESVAVAVHVMVSPGEEVEVVSVSVAPLPSSVPSSLVQP